MIGDYKIGKLIGEGAFSKVKLGIHIHSGKKVAIKIINKKMMQESNEKSAKDKAKRAAKKGIKPTEAPPTSPTDSAALNFINNLENEVQLLMRLDHPNVIKTYQVIDSEEECYVVMQYASGGEMMEYLAAKGSLTEKEAKKFFAQLVSGLEHIHLASIVHRDMKLENLLLDDKQNLLITDFGLGRTFETDRMHLLDTFCGTPHYAAVELVSGIPYIGIKSDIWALGVILYFLVVGSAPFGGNTIAELYDNIRNVKYDVYDFFTPELTDLLDKILQKNPIDRITLQQIREHKWMEGVDCPVVPPKLSGKVDSAKLGQVVKSINSELSYVCYTFNNYEAPIPKHLSSSRGDATRRQRSNSAVTARKKSYSIGKEARPALETILGKDGRPVAEGSVGKNFILGQDVRVMVEGSVYSNVSSPYSSTDKDLKPSAESITSSRPTAESSVGRFGEIAGGKLWADSLPAESSPLKSMALVTETSEDVITDRGETTRRGAFGYKRGSFSRKVAVSLRPNQEGSFFSKAPPTVPRNEVLNNSNSPPATAVARPSSPPKTDLKSEPPLPQKLVLEPGISGSLKSLQISPDNSATLDDVIEAAKQLKVTNQPPQESRRRRAVTALPSTVIRPIKISPSEETKIMEDENADQPTRLMSLTKRLNSPPRSYSKFEKADDTNNLTSSPSAAISVISSDHSNSGEMAILARRLSMVGQPAEDNSETSKMDGLTAKLKLENFDIKDVIAWHEIHKPPKMIRTVKFGFRRGTSSTLLDTATMFQDVHKALMALPECQSKKLKYKRHPDYYNFSCTYSEDGVKDLLKFDVEICRVWLLDVHACKTFNVICSEDEKAGWRGNVI